MLYDPALLTCEIAFCSYALSNSVPSSWNYLHSTVSYYLIYPSGLPLLFQVLLRHFLPLSHLFKVKLYSLYAMLFLPSVHIAIVVYAIIKYIYMLCTYLSLLVITSGYHGAKCLLI